MVAGLIPGNSFVDRGKEMTVILRYSLGASLQVRN